MAGHKLNMRATDLSRSLPRGRAHVVAVDSILPSSVDVVVIGAGIAGMATALTLVEAGLNVLVCEKGHVAAEQSSRAFGWICNLGLDPIKIDLTARSKTLWAELSQRVEADCGYHRSGLMHLCETEADIAREQAWLDSVKDNANITARFARGDELAALLPGSARRWPAALYQPDDGYADPTLAVPAMAAAFRRKGGRLLEHCAVRSLQNTAGRLSGVVTERGMVACQAVVLAGGAWSRRFCENEGLFLPLLHIHSPLLELTPLPGGPECCIAAHGFACRRTPAGGYVLGPEHGHEAMVTPDSFRLFREFLPALRRDHKMLKLRFGAEFFRQLRQKRRWQETEITPFENERVLDPLPDITLMQETWQAMADAFPMVRQAEIAAIWAGVIDATPDSTPVIGPVTARPGLHICTGFSAYGLTMGLAAGEMAAQLLLHQPPVVDPFPYRFQRFSDGSKLRLA